MDWVVETILPKEVRKLAQKIDEKDSALALLNDDLAESQLALQRERSLRRLQSYDLTIANNLLEVRSMEIENLIINRHVPLSGRGYDEVFVIVKKNCDHNERFPLYLICRQKRSVKQALKDLRTRYPYLEVIARFDTPNSIQGWNDMKMAKPPVIECSERHFRILVSK